MYEVMAVKYILFKYGYKIKKDLSLRNKSTILT